SGAIERAAHTQAQLIEDLLDVSRIVAGKMKIEPVPTDPAAAVGAAIEAVGALAKKKSIQIDSTLDPATPWVSADPIRLQQIVWNLLVNAVKFTPDGGKIAIELAPADGGVRLRVRDDGIGIPPELLPKIFDRFV